MTEQATHGARSRTLGLWLLAVVAIAFVVANRHDVPDAARALRHANLAWLAVGLGATAAWLGALVLVHVMAQRAAGLDASPGPLVRPVLAGHSLNLLTKSGGMAGLAPMVADGRRRGRPVGPVAAGYVLVTVVNELAFATALAVALAVVAIDGGLSRAELAATGVFVLYAASRVVVVILAVRSRAAARRVVEWPRRVARRLRRRAEPATADHTTADELHEAALLLRRSPGRCIPVLVGALVLEAIAIVEVLAAAAAVGAGGRLSTALVAYAISVLFAIVGFLPGGLGFVEVSLAAVLVSRGAPGAVAAAAVVVYRLFELWLPLTAGLVARRRAT